MARLPVLCALVFASQLLGPLALTASLPLLASALLPGVVPSLVLWALVGVLSAYQVTANAEFVRITPTERPGEPWPIRGGHVTDRLPAEGRARVGLGQPADAGPQQAFPQSAVVVGRTVTATLLELGHDEFDEVLRRSR
ncbi:hypothetical protein AB0M44_28025 [Streptosporangium subroseum]|uniref:hypothetical protein n=1 Tax=Streptosporangium subroseum TaxID=106412 RepID=UPI003421B478